MPKGQIPWNKGLVGKQKAWNKGLKNPYSEETIEKMRLGKLGTKRSKDSIEKMILKNTGKKRTEEAKKKMSEARLKLNLKGVRTNTGRTHFKKGHIPWCAGKKLTEAQLEKRRVPRPNFIPWNKDKHLGKFVMENNQWKGNDVSYRTIHKWVERYLGKPKECSICGKEKNRMSWSNIDHKYRRELEDYKRMCPKCHGHYDKVNNLRKRK